jgi:hypothetical protein
LKRLIGSWSKGIIAGEFRTIRGQKTVNRKWFFLVLVAIGVAFLAVAVYFSQFQEILSHI